MGRSVAAANRRLTALRPVPRSAADIASRVSAALDRPVASVQLAEDELVQRLKPAGISEWEIAGLRAQYAVIAGGSAIDVTEEVPRLTGRAPRTFLELARDALAPAVTAA